MTLERHLTLAGLAAVAGTRASAYIGRISNHVIRHATVMTRIPLSHHIISTFSLYFNMAVALRSNLAREIKSVLPLKRVNLKKPFRCGSLSNPNHSHNTDAHCNSLIYSPITRNVIQKLGQSATFHSSGYKAILPPGPREL